MDETTFSIRPCRNHEIGPDDPRQHMLIVTRGNSSDLHPVSLTDLSSLVHTGLAYLLENK